MTMLGEVAVSVSPFIFRRDLVSDRNDLSGQDFSTISLSQSVEKG